MFISWFKTFLTNNRSSDKKLSLEDLLQKTIHQNIIYKDLINLDESDLFYYLDIRKSNLEKQHQDISKKNKKIEEILDLLKAKGGYSPEEIEAILKILKKY